MAVEPARPLGRERVGASPFGRVVGLGSLFGKTIRDSRRAFAVNVALIAGVMLVAGAATAAAFGTASARHEALVLATTLPPIFQGFLGRIVHLETLGGLLEWRYHTVFLLLPGIWSIVALSGTLAAEARTGSLEFVAAAPLSRSRIALEKLAAHAVAVTAAMIVVAFAGWLTGALFATLPGDAIPAAASAGYAILVGLLILAPGSIAFALAPFLGRGAAAGVAGIVMVAMYVINGFRDSIPAFQALAPLSWYAWTANHVPLAGQTDWPSLVPLAAIVVVGWTVGVVAFARRDVGVAIRLPTPRMPRALVGIRGPLERSFSERLPAALAWGLGLAVYAWVLAASAASLAASIRGTPAIERLMRVAFPNVDFTSPGGVLQLAFVSFAVVVFGFAAATIVGGWASDESSGRLEVLLSTPLSRARWAMRSGAGVYLAILALTAVVGIGAAIGSVASGGDALTPAIGMAAPGLYAAAVAGIGLAVGGLLRPSWASATVVAVTLATFLVDLFVPALGLPDWLHELALTAHLGRSLVGQWDVPGLLACAALAVGGLALATWGIARRDVRA